MLAVVCAGNPFVSHV